MGKAVFLVNPHQKPWYPDHVTVFPLWLADAHHLPLFPLNMCARVIEPDRQTGERRSYLAALRSSMRQSGGVFGLLYTNITLPCLLLLITCD